MRAVASIFLSVALVSLAGHASLARGDSEFPALIQMPSDTTASGVAVDKIGNVYVSVRQGGHGIIWRYTPDGTVSLLADLGHADIYGLYARANGDLYAAMAIGADRGVYRLDREGTAELLPGSSGILFPNGFAFDDCGTLYVTESHSAAGGGIWRIPPGGAAEVWLRDPLLDGLPITGGPVGANGIAYFHGDLYVTNTNKRLILRVPVTADGSPGSLEVWKQVGEVTESPLAGSGLPVMPDGLALDAHGNLYVAILTRNAIVRVGIDDRVQQTVAVLAASSTVPVAPFDMPASVAFGTGTGEQQNLFVTNLGWMVRFIPAGTWPGASLLKIPVGVPGRPLH